MPFSFVFFFFFFWLNVHMKIDVKGQIIRHFIYSYFNNAFSCIYLKVLTWICLYSSLYSSHDLLWTLQQWIHFIDSKLVLSIGLVCLPVTILLYIHSNSPMVNNKTIDNSFDFQFRLYVNLRKVTFCDRLRVSTNDEWGNF